MTYTKKLLECNYHFGCKSFPTKTPDNCCASERLFWALLVFFSMMIVGRWALLRVKWIWACNPITPASTQMIFLKCMFALKRCVRIFAKLLSRCKLVVTLMRHWRHLFEFSQKGTAGITTCKRVVSPTPNIRGLTRRHGESNFKVGESKSWTRRVKVLTQRVDESEFQIRGYSLKVSN